jgi:hypothetical protein
MKVRAYAVLRRAIEEGVDYGWRRASGILNEVCEYFDFEDEERP